MEVENRLGLMGKSKVAAKAETVKMFLKIKYRMTFTQYLAPGEGELG